MKDNERKNLVTTQVVKSMSHTLTELSCLNRWSAYINDYRYNELNKQSLNSVIAFFLAAEAENDGKKVDITKFPKIILHRAFEKLVLCDIREDFIDRILKLGSIDKKIFNKTIKNCIEKQMGKKFSAFINIDNECLESKIFQAATKLGTKLELFELKAQIPEEDYIETLKKLDSILLQYNDLSGTSRIALGYSNEMNFFKKTSALRNRIRWQKRSSIIKCAVLGHNLEVAIIAYLMALKQHGNEEIATKCFFIGLFHDVPETYTGDMPKPIKDAIPGLRSATECFEMEMVNYHIYSKMTEYIRAALCTVMLEENGQEEYKALIKKADYFSADLECLRNIVAGSHEPYFKRLINKELKLMNTDAEIDGLLKTKNPYHVFYEAFKDLTQDIL